jgi:uncharacterized damage-inducible protein DinB
MREYLHNLARYDAWANEQLIRSLAGAAATDERVLHLAGHLLAATRVWLGRIRGEDTQEWNLWPVLAIETLIPMLREADQQMLSLTASETENFDRIIHYRNQSGKFFDTKLSDILIHIVNHATYHRGQLATAVKNAGGEPAVTDYIAWVRIFEKL